jgi:mannose-6-phosphate isomerase-like protein (cupin superfamily)
MRRFAAACVIVVAAAVSANAQTPDARRAAPPAAGEQPLPATDITAANIAAFLKALPRDVISDRPIRVVNVGGYQVGVYGVFRPKALPGDAILHETTTSEVYYMLSGSATLVTGGTIAGSKPSQGNSTSPRGERIDGGVSRKVVPGDVIIIPGRTPHWWSQLDGDIQYLIIRPDPESRLSPK